MIDEVYDNLILYLYGEEYLRQVKFETKYPNKKYSDIINVSKIRQVYGGTPNYIEYIDSNDYDNFVLYWNKYKEYCKKFNEGIRDKIKYSELNKINDERLEYYKNSNFYGYQYIWNQNEKRWV